MNNGKGPSPEVNRMFIEKNIPAAKFSKLTIVEGDEARQLSPVEAKKYIIDMVTGGKKLTQVEKQLIKDGVKGPAWEDRKKLMKLLGDFFEDKLSDEDVSELREELEAIEVELDSDNE